MKALTSAELQRLPDPDLFKLPRYADLLAERKALLNALQPMLFNDQQQPALLPAELIEDDSGRYWRIDVSEEMGLLYLALSSEPGVKQLEIASYLDLLNAQKINEMGKSNLLAFAYDAQLDHLGAFYGVKRLAGESDKAFRARIQLSIRGWAPGTLDYYEFQARSAAAGIRNVRVDLLPSEQMQDAVIRITIMAETTTGEPSAALLETIREYVNHTGVKLNNDVLQVEAVQLVPVNLTVTLFLLPDALPGIAEQRQQTFPGLFDQNRALGWDVTRSWVSAQHQVTGVKRVELDWAGDQVIGPNQCAVLQNYRVLTGGVEW